jgi:hypothetical protein
MISLSDEELGIVMTLAAPLHPARRSAFLEAVVLEASRYGAIGPGLLNRIGRELQKRFTAPTTRLEPGGSTRQHARRPASRP